VIAVLLAVAAALLSGAALLWALSVRLRDASIADVAWGPAFALVAWLAVAVTPAPGPRALLAAGLTSLWAARLALHLHARRRSCGGEDRRYAAMRASAGPRFAGRSLVTVFLLQAGLAFVVSLPLQAASALGSAALLGPLDAVGVALFATGFALEALADRQLARFRAEAASAGAVMDRGLWRWSRHPNYFGDAVLWWGLGLLGLASGAAWSLAGPALMTLLLRRVSGVTLLESTIGERRPGYAQYVARTSAFVPLPPRGPHR